MRRSITCGDGGPLGHDLSCREREVLTLLVQRLTDKEIAGVLSISPRTVMSHVTSILTKLGAANRREAGEIAIRLGLVTWPDRENRPPSFPAGF
jgi:DNA-binding NarL/FixJ family response regulator